MSIAIRYFTSTGHTKQLAEAIGEAIGVEAKDVSLPLEDKVDILFLGSAMYAGGIDGAVKNFIADNKNRIGKIYSFSSATLATSTYKQIKKVCDEQGVALAEEEFHCKGAFGIVHKNRPNAEDLQNAATFAVQIVNK